MTFKSIFFQEYLRSTDHPLVPISVIKSGFVSGDIDPNAWEDLVLQGPF